jgi:T5SS/PEP-CTERM-associated repeat protein
MKRLTSMAAAIGTALALTTPVRAANNDWNVTADGLWQDAGKWTLGRSPEAGDTVRIINAGNKTVTIDADTPELNLTVNALTVSSGAAGETNSLLIANALAPLKGQASGGTLTIGSAAGQYGAITVTNATLDTTAGTAGGAASIGSSGVGSITLLAGGVWDAGAVSLSQLAGGSGTVDVLGGSFVATNQPPYIGNSGVGRLTVSNGGTALLKAGSRVAYNANSKGVLTVDDGGSVRVTGAITVGNSSGSMGTIMLIGGELVSGQPILANAAGAFGQVTVSNGTWKMNNISVGQVGAGVLAIADGTVSNTAGTFYIGNVAGSRGTLEMTGGLLVSTDTTAGTTYIGYRGVGSVAVSNATWLGRDVKLGGFLGGATGRGTLTIENGGSVRFGGSVTAGAAATATNNTVLVSSGGLLEAVSLVTGTNVANTIANEGGGYQFATATPTITVGGRDVGNAISVSNGFVSFRGVTGVNVKGNWSGTQLANMTFAGENALRLDSATNAATPDQSYTFMPGLGATNYARLHLWNGSTYRGGDVMIGNGGALSVAGGVSSIEGDLSLQSGGAYEVTLGPTGTYSRLAVGGTVAIGGATLNISLSSAPEQDYPYVIIANDGPNPVSGQFASSTVSATFGGKEYTFGISYGGGDGNDVVASWRRGGTLITIR